MQTACHMLVLQYLNVFLLQVEVVGKARQEYGDGLLRITQWLKDAEDLLAREVPCTHTALRDYLSELEVSILDAENAKKVIFWVPWVLSLLCFSFCYHLLKILRKSNIENH